MQKASEGVRMIFLATSERVAKKELWLNPRAQSVNSVHQARMDGFKPKPLAPISVLPDSCFASR